jgi:ribosome biogenesis GTPase A
MGKFVRGTPPEWFHTLPDEAIVQIFNEATREMIEIDGCLGPTGQVFIARYAVKGRWTNTGWELLEDLEKTRQEANSLFNDWMENGFGYYGVDNCEEEEDEEEES